MRGPSAGRPVATGPAVSFYRVFARAAVRSVQDRPREQRRQPEHVGRKPEVGLRGDQRQDGAADRLGKGGPGGHHAGQIGVDGRFMGQGTGQGFRDRRRKCFPFRGLRRRGQGFKSPILHSTCGD